MSKPFKIFLGVIGAIIVGMIIWMMVDSIIKKNQEDKLQAILDERGIDACTLMMEELGSLYADPKVQAAAGIDPEQSRRFLDEDADFGDAMDMIADIGVLRHEAAKEYLRREGIDVSLAAALNRLTMTACIGRAFDEMQPIGR